ncbi:MAG: aldehyde dehydrogenase family protein, partial [Pseudomonadota bacterium]
NGTPFIAGMGAISVIPADWFQYYAGWVDTLEGTVPVSNDPTSLWYTRRVPFGVVGIITAYNAPMAFMGLKVAAALAAGNTVVVKPSELAPWAVLRFAEICREVGVPDGVVNILPGGREAGEALVSHPDVDRLTFTGGDQTARAIMGLAAQNLTPVTLELGGKSASIIFEDANIEAAAQLAIQGSSAFINGQACVAGARVLAQRSVYEQVTEALAAVSNMLPVGDPASPDTIIGPVISEHHCNRIMSIIDNAGQSEGAKVVCGGERVGGDFADGYFIKPTVVAGVTPDSSLAQNEVFGPVVSVTPFDTEEEAIAIANNSRYGLAGYVHTQNLGCAHRVAQSIDAGVISVNAPYMVPSNVPFGGMKASGFGREGGPEGIFEMTHSQSIQIGMGG